MNNVNFDNPLYGSEGITEEERERVLASDRRMAMMDTCFYCKEKATHIPERVARGKYKAVERQRPVATHCLFHAEEEARKQSRR